MKKLIATLIIALCLCGSVQAAGLTLWTLTDQLTSIDEDNSISGRVGYSFASDNGGLEIYVGSTWYKTDATPQVMSLGIVEHLPDLIDPNNPLPWIPGLLTAIVNEEVVMAPYVGIQGTFQFVDEDAGLFGVMAGVKIKVTPKSASEWIVEGRYINPFGDLYGVNKAQLSVGLRIPF